jgi:hypothetical protein
MCANFKFLIGISFLVLTISKSFGQIDTIKRIEYLIPDDVRDKILEVLKTEKPREPYFAVWNTKNDTTSILLADYNSSDVQLSKLLKSSNRYINLSKTKSITVVFGPDLLFSTIFHQVKNKGQKNEIVQYTDWGLGGYIITFTGRYGESKLIKVEYHQN